MVPKRDELLNKVRKLLALQRSSNPNEAALAAERVQTILVKYNISIKEVELKPDDDGIVAITVGSSGSQLWRQRLGKATSMLYFCEYYYEEATDVVKHGHVRHQFVGQPHNVAVASLMFDYLHSTIERLSKQGARKQPELERASYRATFQSACTNELCRRILERIERAKTTGITDETGRALVVLDMYEQAKANNSEFMNEKFGKEAFSKLPTKTVASHFQGEADGMEAGTQIGLDPQVGRGGNRMLK